MKVNLRRRYASVGRRQARILLRRSHRPDYFAVRPPTTMPMSDFVGIEQTARDDHLTRLLESRHWPDTSTDGVRLVPEKGAQHGAATLLRTASEQGRLRISWAVFLPIAETPDVIIDLGREFEGGLRVLLHGYFFLDAGRRHIEGLDDLVQDTDPEPDNEAALRRSWNEKLRDTVVLPLILPLLKYALDRRIVTEEQFSLLVQSLAASKWFRKHREAICKHSSLVRVLEGDRGSRQVRWRLVPTDTKLRSLPATLAGHPERSRSPRSSPARLDDLLDGIDEWKRRHRITLCIDKNASLTARPTCWTTDDFDLFEGLMPRVFQSDSLARLAVSLLSEVSPRPEGHETIRSEVLRAFRDATIEPASFAATTLVSRLLEYVPRDRLIRLPSSVQRRDVLRALAQPGATVLPTRREFIGDEDHIQPGLTRTELERLLRQLAPIVQGDDTNAADQAAASALTLIENSDNQELRTADGLQDLSVIRAHWPDGTPLWLSFAQLFRCSDRGMLFQQAPRVESYLSTLVSATRSAVGGPAAVAATPLVIDPTTNSAFGGIATESNRASFCDIINSSTEFGADYARSQMITLLHNLPGEDDDRVRRAMRTLCAGDRRAGIYASLWDASQFVNLERVVKLILAEGFLVPHSILAVLSPNMQQQLGITELNDTRFQEFIRGSIGQLAVWQPCDSERRAFLTTNLDEALLGQLPIHPRSDGTYGVGHDLFWVDETTDSWRIPGSLQDMVYTAQLYDDPALRDRQMEVLTKWSRRTQIEVALSQDDCHVYQKDIIAALPLQESGDRLIAALRTRKWLTYDEHPIAPKELLNVPAEVDHPAGRVIKDYKSIRGVSLSDDVFDWLLQQNVIPDRQSSLMRLAEKIVEIRLVGRLGSASSYPVEHFRQLAASDLRLPGWPLLASLLPSLVGQGNHALCCGVVGAFQRVAEGDVETAAGHLNALSELAELGVSGAEEAYCHGFEAVARWNPDARSAFFRVGRVPTESGAWGLGAQVVASGHDIASDSLLRQQYAEIIGDQEGGGLGVDRGRERGLEFDDLTRMKNEALEQHRGFLNPWLGVVPSELITIYLLVVVRGNEKLKELLPEGWNSGPIAGQLDDLDRAIQAEQGVRGLVLLAESDDNNVEAISLSGEKIVVPLHHGSGIVVGNHHRRSIRYQEPGQSRVRIIDARVRNAENVLGLEDSGHVRVFRKFIEEIASECLS